MIAHAWHDEPHTIPDRHLTRAAIGVLLFAALLFAFAMWLAAQ